MFSWSDDRVLKRLPSPRLLGVRSLAVLLAASAASAAGAAQSSRWLDLGTRGHSAEVVSATGLDGPRARIVARHTRATARNYCEALAAYEGRRPDDQSYTRPCVRQALSEPPQQHVASADCTRGLVTVPWEPMWQAHETWGPTFRYGGQHGLGPDTWIDHRTGKILGVGSASNHEAVSRNFELLCPSKSRALRPSLNERREAYLRGGAH